LRAPEKCADHRQAEGRPGDQDDYCGTRRHFKRATRAARLSGQAGYSNCVRLDFT
jgi:hypothetical protein